jgi:cap1 methyltransferase
MNLGIFANDPQLEKTNAFSTYSIPFTNTFKEVVPSGPISSSEELRHKIRGGLATEDTRVLPQNFKAQRHEADEGNYPHEQSIEYIHCKNPNTTGSIYKIVTTTDISSENIHASPYCLPDVIKDVMLLKSEFDDLQDPEFIDARYRANPYEKIGKSVFTNRAAIKMANIDKVTRVTDVEFLEDEKNKLYFADICAGPGGFTEFIYYKFKTEASKGFGITLKGKEDWKLDKFNSESPHDNFEISYGADDTGDICLNENILAFSDLVDKGTDGRGVALLLADGGFSVQGVENQQEGLTKQLVLSQIIAALTCCRKGGNFTVKVFDLYTNFSVSLSYILFQSFEAIVQ